VTLHVFSNLVDQALTLVRECCQTPASGGELLLTKLNTITVACEGRLRAIGFCAFIQLLWCSGLIRTSEAPSELPHFALVRSTHQDCSDRILIHVESTATLCSIDGQPPSAMNATTREGSARVTRAQLRDLQQEITLFTNQSSDASGLSNKSGLQARKTDDDGDQGDWLEMLESRIAHLESVVASICHQAHDCSVYAKAENIERWLSTMIGAHIPKADKPLSRTRLAR
jgi:hypothetical protein